MASHKISFDYMTVLRVFREWYDTKIGDFEGFPRNERNTKRNSVSWVWVLTTTSMNHINLFIISMNTKIDEWTLDCVTLTLTLSLSFTIQHWIVHFIDWVIHSNQSIWHHVRLFVGCVTADTIANMFSKCLSTLSNTRTARDCLYDQHI